MFYYYNDIENCQSGKSSFESKIYSFQAIGQLCHGKFWAFGDFNYIIFVEYRVLAHMYNVVVILRNVKIYKGNLTFTYYNFKAES